MQIDGPEQPGDSLEVPKKQAKRKAKASQKYQRTGEEESEP